jgi:hypothetical protein
MEKLMIVVTEPRRDLGIELAAVGTPPRQVMVIRCIRTTYDALVGGVHQGTS